MALPLWKTGSWYKTKTASYGLSGFSRENQQDAGKEVLRQTDRQMGNR